MGTQLKVKNKNLASYLLIAGVQPFFGTVIKLFEYDLSILLLNTNILLSLKRLSGLP